MVASCFLTVCNSARVSSLLCAQSSSSDTVFGCPTVNKLRHAVAEHVVWMILVSRLFSVFTNPETGATQLSL